MISDRTLVALTLLLTAGTACGESSPPPPLDSGTADSAISDSAAGPADAGDGNLPPPADGGSDSAFAPRDGAASDSGARDASTDAGPTCTIPTPCPGAATAEHRMVPLDECAYELALEAPLSEGEALADRLLTRVASAQPLDDVLAHLNRTGRAGISSATSTRLAGLGASGFRWNAGDEGVDYWYPQGITGSADASADGLVSGRRLLLVSWYHRTDARPTKGARLTLVDLDSGAAPRYRHLLLVDPTEGSGGANFGPAEYDGGDALHGGGIAWVGRYLYVADTAVGLRLYDLGRIFQLANTDDPNRIGISPGRVDAHGYRYAVPRVGRYALTTRSCSQRFSFVAVGRVAGGRAVLTTGNYQRDAFGGRLADWPLDEATGLLGGVATTAPVSATAAVGAAQTRMQGSLRIDDAYYISSSSQDGSNGRLYRNRSGATSTSIPWVYGCEDLYFDPATDRLWTPAEHPGRRDVVSVLRP